MKKNIRVRIVSYILCVTLAFSNMDIVSFAMQNESNIESDVESDIESDIECNSESDSDNIELEGYEEARPMDSKDSELDDPENLTIECDNEIDEEYDEKELIQTGDEEKYMPSYSSTLPKIITQSSSKKIVAEMEGTYYTATAEKILSKLNQIRKEACENGYRNPSTGKKLKASDYKPLKWSSDMEAIARQRAAEAAVKVAHERPNKQSCFTARTSNDIQSYGENLAWNWETGSNAVMYGINQWYGEMSMYLDGDYSSRTGHYQSIINPSYSHVAVSAFSIGSEFWTSVAQEFYNSSYSDRQLNVEEYNVSGPASVPVEISVDYVDYLQLYGQKTLITNSTGEFAVTAHVIIPYNGSTSISADLKVVNAELSSSDPSIIQINTNGVYHTFEKIGEVTISSKKYADLCLPYTIEVISEEDILRVTKPTKTTYYVGESISYAGGKVCNHITGKTVNLSNANVSGFSSTTPGECILTVKDGEYEKNFTVLIVDRVSLEADFGTQYKDLTLPTSPYGTYSLNVDDEAVVDKVGIYDCKATFTPNDETYSVHDKIPGNVKVTRAIDSEGMEILTEDTLSNNTYQGEKISPKVSLKADGVPLKENIDFKVIYGDEIHNNIDVASGGCISIEGMGNYKGTVEKLFTIQKAKLTVKANSYRISATRTALPAWKSTILGLVGTDEVTRIGNKSEAQSETINVEGKGYAIGTYVIEPKLDFFKIENESGVDVSANYEVQGESGTVEIYNPDITYRIHYEMNHHGTEPSEIASKYVKSGEAISKPEDPTAEGYHFEGWYKDANLTNLWDFSKDIVSEPTTLYAKWLKISGEFSVSDIATQYYTGSAIKPKITVYDGEKLLKEKKDYTVYYFKNIEVSSDEYQPSIVITGKGNYTGEKKVDFSIEPMPLNEGTDNKSLAKGVSVSCKDVITSSTRVITPVTAVKYKKMLKHGQDYTVSIKPIIAKNINGESVESSETFENQIPAGMYGTFQIEVIGIGNYSGRFMKTIAVTDSKHQINSATITIASAYKKMKYCDGDAVIVPRKAITVKCGGKVLTYGREYTISYQNTSKVGTATITVVGVAPYYGSKTVTYAIEGNKFDAKSVTIEELPKTIAFTGKPQILKHLQVIWKKGTDEERQLSYGSDYIISYKNNINVGTMTVTYKACEDSGYIGSFSKTVNITAADIAGEAVDNQSSAMDDSHPVAFAKAGATIEDRVVLKNQATGNALVLGKDYTISYANHEAIGNSSSTKEPVATIEGKGNYMGKIYVPFAIVPKSLEAEPTITVTSKELQYSSKKKANYVYKPSVTVKDGKSPLGTNDIKIEYVNCDQVAVTQYIEKLAEGQVILDEDIPYVIITAVEKDGYQDSIIHKLHLFQGKLTSSNTYIVVEDTNNGYTGNQVKPTVRVYKTTDRATLKLIQQERSHEEIMRLGGDQVLQLESDQFAVSYGANVVSGNKGTVTVTGKGIYGGSVTAKFSIGRREIR